MKKYQVGDVVKVKIIGIQPYGAFSRLDEDYVGLIHISEISERFVKDIGDYLHIDEEVECEIIDIDEETNHVKLSLKRLKKNRKRQSRLNKHVFIANKLEEFIPLKEYCDESLNKAKESWVSMKINLNYLKENIDFASYTSKVKEIDESMKNKTGLGNDFLGWYEYPNNINEKEVNAIINLASEYRSKYDTLVVIGIGGSYLGARAAIEAINGLYKKDKMDIIYLGNTFSEKYTHQVLEVLKNRNFAVNVISKSGKTTEPAIAFRLVKELLIEKYGKDYANRIVVTTDSNKGALVEQAKKEGYKSFIIPDDIGGRYSVFTPVGLVPIACAGIDIHSLLLGAKKAYMDLVDASLEKNVAYKYAVIRNYLYNKGYKVEMLVNYEPQMAMFNEWFKQLFGESEGKNGKSLLPTSTIFSTDLHSLGQFIQEGSKVLFETTLKEVSHTNEIIMKKEKDDTDELNYLDGKSLASINDKAMEGTLKAHSSGGVPNIVLEYDELDAYNIGYIFYFMMRACAMSSYLNGVNPFNQPGVEIYKSNMFELLGKGK